MFPKLIDRIFGERALSLKFVFRSAIASLVAVSLVFLFWWRLIPSKYHVVCEVLTGLRWAFHL